MATHNLDTPAKARAGSATTVSPCMPFHPESSFNRAVCKRLCCKRLFVFVLSCISRLAAGAPRWHAPRTTWSGRALDLAQTRYLSSTNRTTYTCRNWQCSPPCADAVGYWAAKQPQAYTNLITLAKRVTRHIRPSDQPKHVGKILIIIL